MCKAVSDLVNKFLYESEEAFKEEAALYGSEKGVDAAMKLRKCADDFSGEERPAYYDLVVSMKLRYISYLLFAINVYYHMQDS